MSDEPTKVAYALPSEAAKAGHWDIAQELVKASWDPEIDDDAEALAAAVEALFQSPMSCLDGIDSRTRWDIIAEYPGVLEEAEAALEERLRWIKEERKEGRFDLSWLPDDVRSCLIFPRTLAMREWVNANPDPNAKERPPLDPMCCIDEFGSVPYPEYTSLLGELRQSRFLEEYKETLLKKFKENNS